MIPVAQQLEIFVLTIAMGVIIGLIFDVYRVVWGRVHPRKSVTAVGDIGVWILLAGVTFWLLYYVNWGEVRVYVFLGVALGVFCHLQYTSSAVVKSLHKVLSVVERCLHLISRGASFFGKVLRSPLRIPKLIIWATNSVKKK